MKTYIIITSPVGSKVAEKIKREWNDFEIIPFDQERIRNEFKQSKALIFIGAMGICVRSIAPVLDNKKNDPAVICIDSMGKQVISVLSGHIGGANILTNALAKVLGAQSIITTQSDLNNLWALDTLASTYDWETELQNGTMNEVIADFVNGNPIYLLLNIRDKGTDYLERTLPTNVTVYYNESDLPIDEQWVIAVTPFILNENKRPILYFRPHVLHLGIGCKKDCSSNGVIEYIEKSLKEMRISPLSIGGVATIKLKENELFFKCLKEHFNKAICSIYSTEELVDIQIPNPSEHVFQVTGVYGVSESTARKSARLGDLLIEKQKEVLTSGNNFTWAVAMDKCSQRKGHIEIVGAGPGDPDLISVRGRQLLETADLILYAGSLVPRELTECAKDGATVASSASMNLEEQFILMKEFYDKGCLVVRLHTGDPCIYGAIQEQMAFFDQYNMSYHITPGISSFQAAAAALESQFTIPEKVQTIILTRGEGRTSMPEKEKLHLLARSQSTMCIFLSAGVAEQVQKELLEAYPESTPVAVCYHLTWKDEKIFRGKLIDLAKIVKENNLTLTTMIVVGEAIDNRHGLSRLYADEFKHLFRK